MFTRSPTTGDRSVITIEGAWGLGSAVVERRSDAGPLGGRQDHRRDHRCATSPTSTSSIAARRRAASSSAEVAAERRRAGRACQRRGAEQLREVARTHRATLRPRAGHRVGDRRARRHAAAAEPPGNRVVGEGRRAGGARRRRIHCSRHVDLRRATVSLTAKDVAEITRLLEDSSFDELDLEMNGVKIHLRRRVPGAVPVSAVRDSSEQRASDTRHQRATGRRRRRPSLAPHRRRRGARAAARHLLSRAEARRAAVRRSRRRVEPDTHHRHHRGDEADEHGARRRRAARCARSARATARWSNTARRCCSSIRGRPA